MGNNDVLPHVSHHNGIYEREQFIKGRNGWQMLPITEVG